MQTMRRALGVGLAYSAVLVGCALIGSQTAHSQGQGKGQPPGPNVTVVNTFQNPVPVVGQVMLAPGGKVGIDPAANIVQVASTPAAPLLIQDLGSGRLAADRYGDGRERAIDDGEIGESLAFDIPEGKCLVIETVTVRARLPPGQAAEVELLYWAGLALQVRHLSVESQGVIDGRVHLIGTHPIRILADDSDNPNFDFDLRIDARRSAVAGSGFLSAGVSGYLMDL
jgi:hypothetical protein